MYAVPKPQKMKGQIEEEKTFLGLAGDLGTAYIRTFGTFDGAEIAIVAECKLHLKQLTP